MTWIAILAMVVALQNVATQVGKPLHVEVDLEGGVRFTVRATKQVVSHLDEHVDFSRVERGRCDGDFLGLNR